MDFQNAGTSSEYESDVEPITEYKPVEPFSTNAAFLLIGQTARIALIEAALRAAADNHDKAVKEANRGAFHFARIHELASIYYEEDALAMIAQTKPVHRSIEHYLATGAAYARINQGRPILKNGDAPQRDLIPVEPA